eukprot:c15873_g1_i1.p1 GENE.c15873_g1_i1~~c15873_g1_i1.p1  ORF type:complete len:250 (-),score=108.78 c15873_g1_i1:46-795(-)
MEGAYFVGRTELLSWLNSTFELNYTKVEQCCTGAAHCQIFDAIYPGSVELDKIVWNAKSEYQYLNNWKILQKAFDKSGVTRTIDVPKITQGKYIDNLEFLQWIKGLFDQVKGKVDEGYDPVLRRSVAASASAALGSTTTTAKASPGATFSNRPGNSRPTRADVANDKKKIEELLVTIEENREENEEYLTLIENLQKERDFYFKKLRDIEIICQHFQGTRPTVVQDVLSVLYGTEEGFECQTAPVPTNQE